MRGNPTDCVRRGLIGRRFRGIHYARKRCEGEFRHNRKASSVTDNTDPSRGFRKMRSIIAALIAAAALLAPMAANAESADVEAVITSVDTSPRGT